MNRIRRGPLGLLTVQVALASVLVIVVVGALAIVQLDRFLRSNEENRYREDVAAARDQFADQFEVYQDLFLVATVWVSSIGGVAEVVERGQTEAAVPLIEVAISAFGITFDELGATVYDADGAPLVSSLAELPDAAPATVLAALDDGAAIRAIRPDDTLGLAISAVAPLRSRGGDRLGVLEIVGPVDQALVGDYSESLRVEIALVTDGETAVTSAPGRFEGTGWPARDPGAPAEYLDGADERYLAVTLPVTDVAGEPLGAFHIGVPESRVTEALPGARIRVLGVVAGGMAVVFLFSLVGIWLTMRPMRRLVAAARRMQANDLQEPVPVTGPAEMRSLAQAMEEMRVAIQQGRETLLSANRELASRVDMSTANLAEVTHELTVMDRVLAQLDGEPPGGVPGVAEALAELEWTGGAVIALANERGTLSIAAIAQVSPGAAATFVNVAGERMIVGTDGDRPEDPGWYVPDTAAVPETARLTPRGIGGFLVQPLVTPDGIAGFVAVTTQGHLALTPRREALVRSVAREIALSLERTELADEVEENRRIAESVLREMSDGVLVLDHAGTCQICNPAAARMLGRSRLEIVGRPADEYLPLDPDEVSALRQRTIEAGGGPSLPLITELGGREIQVSADLFADVDPARAGMIVMLRDLSAEEEAERVKRDFVSMVGHELRTPLTLIRATIEMLDAGDTGELNETQQQVVGVLQNNSDRLMALINDVLDMTALDSGNMQILPDWIDVADAVGSAVEVCRPSAEARQHTITMTAPRGTSAWADRRRVEQIVSNLVGNAIKYTPEGGQIEVTVQENGDLVEVAVTDNGIGIAADEREHLFERFYRATSGRRTTGGTGLGLAIARSLVELHGGTIHCESDGESGSTFAFTLPRRRI